MGDRRVVFEPTTTSTTEAAQASQSLGATTTSTSPSPSWRRSAWASVAVAAARWVSSWGMADEPTDVERGLIGGSEQHLDPFIGRLEEAAIAEPSAEHSALERALLAVGPFDEASLFIFAQRLAEHKEEVADEEALRRIIRAVQAGFWAREVLRGDRAVVGRSERCGEPNAVYVVVRGGPLRQCAGATQDSAEYFAWVSSGDPRRRGFARGSISHAFASSAEAACYWTAAGLNFGGIAAPAEVLDLHDHQ